MDKNNKIVKFIMGIVVVFVVVFIIVGLLSNTSGRNVKEVSEKGFEEYQSKDLESKIAYLKDKINLTTSTPRKASVELTSPNLYDELPDINKYPLTVEGTGDINIEIFASPEKAGTDKDGWIIEVAKEFNEQKIEVDG